MSDEKRGPDSGPEGSDSDRPAESSQEDVAREKEAGRELGWKFKEAEREAEARAQAVATVETERARAAAEAKRAEAPPEDDEPEDELEDDAEDELEDEDELDDEDESDEEDDSTDEEDEDEVPEYTDDLGRPTLKKASAPPQEEFLPFEPDTPRMRVITAVFVIVAFSTIGIFVFAREYFLAGIEKEQQEQVFGVKPVQLDELRASETKNLDHYQWIDKAKGRVRIPVKRATDLVLTEYKYTPMDEPPTEDVPVKIAPSEPEPEEEIEGEGGGAVAPDAPGGDAPAPDGPAPAPAPAPQPAPPAPLAPAPPAPAPPAPVPPAPAPPAPLPGDPSGGI